MQHKNLLEDICKASTMTAASALSRFLKMPINVDINPVEINSVDKIKLPTYINQNLIGLFAAINGFHIKGGSSLLFKEKSGYFICDVLLNRTKGSTNKLNEVEESALKEMMNVVLGNFLTSFVHSLLSSRLLHSPAIIKNNDSLNVTKYIRSLLSESMGNNSALNISFSYKNDALQGDFNIVFESDKILSTLNQVMVLSNG